ncbi:MAG: DMT family transporter [Chitinophagales bacterium]|nr:DMT family transporter [Chitinophagales bacterium]
MQNFFSLQRSQVMLYLLLSVVCASCLVLMFKFFERRGVPIFQAIVFNYWSASLCALLFLPVKQNALPANITQQPWLWLALLLGSMFIVVFNLTSITTVKLGVSTASVASKLGLVFPVMLAFAVYGETFSMLKVIGILFAFAAVVLSSLKPNMKEHSVPATEFLLPVLVFAGSGACDSLTQFANKKYLINNGIEEFTLMLFIAAACTGTLAFIYMVVKHKHRTNRQSLYWGIVLGVLNYFSFLFLLKALAVLSWGSSVVFPLNNLGMVAVATIAGIVLFKEKISATNFAGLLLAAASIITIVLSGT